MHKQLSASLKKEWAKELYVRGEYFQKDIAAKIGVSEKTISRWIDEGHWDKERKTLLATKREQLILLYDQLDALNRQNKLYMEDDDPKTNPNYDAVIKLVNSIKKLENQTGIGEMVDTATAFVKFVSAEDLALAKEITKWFDLFIQSRLKSE